MTIDWQELLSLADNTSYRFVGLSPMSKVLADTSFSFLSRYHSYVGEGYELSIEELDSIKASVAKFMAELEVPMLIGAILPYAGLDVPDGCLPCNGESFLRSDYPYLYNYLVGTALIVDGDNFNTPSFPLRVIMQASPDVLPYEILGESETTLSEPQMPIHTHSYIPAVLNVDLESPGAPDIFAAGVGLPDETGSAGGGEPHNNMQPTIAFNYCIVSGGLYASATVFDESTFFGDAAYDHDTVLDSAPGVVGFKFQVATDGHILAIRFWIPSGATSGNVGWLFQEDGTPIDSAAMPHDADAWVEAEFTTPIAVTTGNTYVAGVYCPDARYPVKGGQFTAELDVGDLIAPADSMGSPNGVAAAGASGTFPDTGYVISLGYGVDVRFIADG